MIIADAIKAARVGKFTQVEMAQSLGMSQPNYANIENGFSTPDAPTLLKIARILNIDLNKLAAEFDVIAHYKAVDLYRKAKAERAQRIKKGVA